ncbi:helix-turn-helix transcriptional regulator [Schleiferilactobacillus harbinensis]|uniref:helix-turn-helix domain-containing protein n=1 Tax=Schleiferilactobacillus harbinensis TaxID=304207 RepID=UPI00123AE417|nr:helix-turn-helix transcriptional regulator [Schleiferilactobacillus harbinensis]QEU47815.1 helix-turn-helix transcriptional regulator [Schleiferilactobacillus harbinensis]
MKIEETFKQLRQERQLSLRQVSVGIVSASTLSRFEQGKTHLSAVTFIRLLDRMQADWSAFTLVNKEAVGNLLQTVLYYADHGDKEAVENFPTTIEEMGKEENSSEYHALCDLLLKNRFKMETSTFTKSLSEAMAKVLDATSWSAFVTVLAKQLIYAATLQSLPTLLNAVAEQLQHEGSHPSELFSMSIFILYQEGVLRLLRADWITAARTALDAIHSVLPLTAEEAFTSSIVKEILANAEGKNAVSFKQTALTLNFFLLSRADRYLHALVPQIAPLMKRQHFSTDLFDVEQLYANYGSSS